MSKVTLNNGDLGLTFRTNLNNMFTELYSDKVDKVTLTDNAIIKANGTSGSIQNTGIIIDDDNNVSGAGVQANIQTGTTYSLVLGDAGKLVTLNNDAPITVTVPANSSVAFPVGTVIDLLQLGMGQVSVEITTDTLNSIDSMRKIEGQYSAASLIKTGSTEWVLIGNITV